MSDKQDQQRSPDTPASGVDAAKDSEAGNSRAAEPVSADTGSLDTPLHDPVADQAGSSGIAWLALLLALGLAAGAGWFFVQAHQREASLTARLQALEAATSGVADTTRELESSTQTLKSRVDAIDDETEALRNMTGQPALAASSSGEAGAPAAGAPADLEALEARWNERLQTAVTSAVAELEDGVVRQSRELQELSAELSTVAGGSEVDINRSKWLLAEVEYLLRLANQRLIMTGDVASAQALLSSADNILRDLNDVGLLEVRRALASDLATLRAMPSIDIEGTYVRLAALIEQVDQLVVFQLPEPAERPVVEQEVEQGWQGRLRRGYEEALAKLAAYVVVRRRQTPAEALMDPQWERLVRQNLRMLLEQAQVALLSGNQVLYRESLERSRHWVQEFFESDAAGAAAMSREIAELAQQTVSVELPDISASMQALDQAVSQRLSPPDAG